jgi:Mg/Co/Ni transporter MgtE
MKVVVFCVVPPCILAMSTDVSEVLAASIIRALVLEALSTSETLCNF